jgi:hypothetical protein
MTVKRIINDEQQKELKNRKVQKEKIKGLIDKINDASTKKCLILLFNQLFNENEAE